MLTGPEQIRQFCIHPDATVRQAMESMNRNERGFVMVVNERSQLLDTLTDGDIRRAMLAGLSLDHTVSSLAQRRKGTPYPSPVSALVGTPAAELLRILHDRILREIPLVDEQNRVVGLVGLRDLAPAESLGPEHVSAVVMAGGVGARLRPLTDKTPKPMLPVAGRPLLEHILGQLRDCGISRINIATHYRENDIKSYFGDGQQIGLDIDYTSEDSPLGSAGALGLMEPPAGPVIVVNGDIFTKLNFKSLLTFHTESKAMMTVGVAKYAVNIPYGVVEIPGDGVLVTAINEKPRLHFPISAGLYVLEPSVWKYLGNGERLDMTDVIKRLLADGKPVAGYPVSELWLDVGTPTDYQLAQQAAVRT